LPGWKAGLLPERGRSGVAVDRWGEPAPKEIEMRQEGARYVCDKCKAAIVYEKGCPCGPEMPHVEICCGQQMRAAETTTKKKS
jgi:hypothetical protein